jgi:signal transduction histidine kinase
MKKLFPKSLAGQTIFVLMIGLAVSHSLSMLIYSDDRLEALSSLGGRHMAQRVANITHLFDESTPKLRLRLAEALSDHTFRVSLSPSSELVLDEDIGLRAQIIRKFIENELGGENPPKIRVQLLDIDDGRPAHDISGPAWQAGLHMVEMMTGSPAHHALRVSIQLGDSQWINFVGTVPETKSFWTITSLISLLSMMAAVIVLSIWVVQRITRPFRELAAAAKFFGKNIDANPLSISGPTEVRGASIAFNEMQQRLQRFVENRTRMLAAISHDIRTPITRLKLRTELLDDSEDKTKMLATLDEIEEMIASTLAFARDDSISESTRTVDLSALLSSICNDLADMGSQVELNASENLHYECRPTSIKRALLNLIENAIKYGNKAEVSLHQIDQEIVITIDDNGPGIPPDRISQVFEPFFRLEESRNSETGGIGLGLSVAQTIINAHGGDITITNREEGGLHAEVFLPI